jgi:branched-chain amino acid transport system permease protein
MVRSGAWPAILGFLAVLAVLALAAGSLSPFALRVGQLMLYSAGIALAWNLMGGLTGYRSFGHAAFIGMGAFAAGLLEAHLGGWHPIARLFMGLAAAALCCALVSALLAYPLLRLRGSYFAIAMLGVSHVAGELNTSIDALSGAVGLMFANVVPEGWDPNVFHFRVFLLCMAIVLAISWAVRRSRFGCGLQSIREDEDTARMLGVPTERYKSLVFVLSGTLTGVLGAVYAHSLGYVNAASLYRDDTNLNLVVYAMLGGIGTLLGPIVGAVSLVLLVHVLLSDYPDVHLFVTGLVLALVVLVAPDGLLGAGRRLLQRFRSRA